MPTPWKPEHIEFAKQNRIKSEIAIFTGKSECAVKTFCQKNGIKLKSKLSRFTSEQNTLIKKHYNNIEYLVKVLPYPKEKILGRIYRMKLRGRDWEFYTPTEDDYLKKHFRKDGNKEIGYHLNRTSESVRKRLKSLGLKRTASEIKKIMDSCNAANTRFYKGHTPRNHKPVGSIRFNVDGYWEIKVKEPRNWDLLHRCIYASVFGPINSENIISFRDGNSQNMMIDNLIKIDRKQAIENSRNTDGHIAFQMARKDLQLRQQILQNRELICLKRKQIQLEKLLKNGKTQTT